MPVTPQQKYDILREAGIDPDKYWIDDSGNVIDLPKDNSAMAGIKTAALNLPRTAAGVGGAALGAAGAGALGLPTGPGAVAAGLAGGFGGAALGSTIGEAIQNAVYPDDVLMAQQARSVRNPGAVQLGDLASMAVFMRPSVSQLRDAGRGIRALTTIPSFAKMRPAQASALMDVGTGGAIGAGSTMAQGGDLGEILKNAAIGAVFSNPTGVTRAMTGGIFSPHVADQGLRDVVNPADLLVKPGEPVVEKPREVNPELLKAFMKQQKADAKLAEQLAALKANQEAAAKKAQIEAEQGIGFEQPLPAQDFTLPPNLNSVEARFLRSQAVEPDVEVTLDPQTKPQPKPPVILEPGTPGALDQELGIRHTQSFFDWWAKNANDNYRTRMTQGRPTGEQGQEVAGVTEGTRGPDGKRNITVNKEAYTDTAPHELTHGMILDVLQHGKKGEQAEMRRLLKLAGVDEEAFVQGVGEDVVRRFMDKTDDSWRSDFVSFMKYKFGKASPEDVRRIMSNTMLRGGGPKGVSKIVAKPTQEVEEKPPVMPEPTEVETSVVNNPARQQDIEAAFAERDRVDFDARMKANMDKLPVSPLVAERNARAAEDARLRRQKEDAFNERARIVRERMRAEDARDRANARSEALDAFNRTRSVADEEGSGTLTPEERMIADAQRYIDIGGEPSLADIPLPEPDMASDLATPRSDELVGQITPEEYYAAEYAKIRRLEEEAAALRRRRDFPRALKQAEGNPAPAPERGERLPGSERRGREREVKRALRSADLENADLSNVGREEVREATKAEFTNKMKQGRVVSENARESAADLEARRIEARLAGEERPRYQEFGKDRTFATDFEKELSKSAPFKIQASKDGRLNRNDIKAAVSKLNPTEQEMLKEAGLEQYLTKVARPTKEELMSWAEENLPRVEVKKLSAEGPFSSKAEKEMAVLAHELDTLKPGWADLLDTNGLPEHIATKIERYEDLKKIMRADAAVYSNDSATRRYDDANINPRQLADMPGAVDLLVRLPSRQVNVEKEFTDIYGEMPKVTEDSLYKSNHYPQSGDNLLAHVRAYEHTMPDGERVLRVFELQSDWAQDRRKDIAQNVYGVNDHPLLPHHQRLALKAAIEHARKRGIKRVVVDDAETAMMTEGHDRIIDRARKEVAEANSGKDTVRLGLDSQGKRVPIEEELRVIERRYKNNGAKFEIKNGKIVMTRGPFEGGMGLSYDNVLQQMMRDLSGDGVKVELGEHRNTQDPNLSSQKRFTNKAEAEAYAGPNGNVIESIFGGEWTAFRKGATRPDLIFRNPDGTPKTQSTGFAYDVSAAQARRDAGEPFSYAGRRYQQFGPNRPTSGLADPVGRKDFSPFESASQKAARSDNPVIRTVGRALTELFPAQRAMRGKYRALPEAFANLNAKDKDLLYKILIDEYRAGQPAPGTVPARLRKEYNDVRRTLLQMRDDQIKAGQRNANGVVPGIDDSYFPNVVDPSVRKTLADEIDSPRFKQLKDEFVKFNEANLRSKGATAAKANEEANKLFNRFIGTLNKQPVEGAFDFGAVVLPEASRLPDNWLHSDPAEAMSQYVRDWSRSRAFHDIVQTNEDVMAGLGQEEFFVNGKKTPVKNRVATPAVKDNNILFLLNEAIGIRRGSQDKITGAIGRAASAAWLANPITRSVDIATSLFKGLGMVTPTQIPGLVSNLRNLGKSYERAHDTGWIREDGNTIVGEVLGAGEAFSNGVDKFSKGLSKYTGSEKLENFGRGLAQNIGEYIARTNTALAQSGNKRATDFLDRVAPNWRTLSEAELGTRIGQLFQGRYDATNLPQWLSDSPAAPFFSLARWNIEQWNNFREFAIKPARNGDPVPLISMLVAGIAGGVGIKEIREALSGRKSKIATLKEIAEAPEGSAKYKELVRYYANLAQLSGTIGIVGEIGNMVLDVASKDSPAAPSMPALEITRDIIPRLIAAGNAMMDGQDPLTVITRMSRDIGNEHVSAYRFLEGMAARTGVSDFAKAELDAANDRRDFRTGKRLRGEPIKAAVQLPINYDNPEERAMEEERDPVKRRQLALALKAKIKQDPDKDSRERKMRAAATSRPSYLPSIENDPKAFREQLDFVRRTQGEDKVTELKKRYLRDKKNSDSQRKMFNQ